MAQSIPYLTTPGAIKKALEQIKVVPTPPKVTQDFVKTKLQIKGGTGDQVLSFLKKIGFVNSDGSPSDIYVRFRNSVTSGAAVADAIRKGYAALYEINEYMHDVPDQELPGLIIQATGQAQNARPVALAVSCIRNLKQFANFGQQPEVVAASTSGQHIEIPGTAGPNHLPAKLPPSSPGRFGMNLSYTINLNLPASADIAVFNAIFKSLKENLLSDIDE